MIQRKEAHVADALLRLHLADAQPGVDLTGLQGDPLPRPPRWRTSIPLPSRFSTTWRVVRADWIRNSAITAPTAAMPAMNGRGKPADSRNASIPANSAGCNTAQTFTPCAVG